MTHLSDKEVLQAAFSKVMKSGWQPQDESIYDIKFEADEYGFPTNPEVVERDMNKHLYLKSAHEVLLSHDFAKALWGVAWQWHLQQMVVSEDNIIGYLRKNT